MQVPDAWCCTQSVGVSPLNNLPASTSMNVNQQLLPSRSSVIKLTLFACKTIFFTALLSSTALQADEATDVVVTPLGSHDGEFCARDRAMLLQDPDGTRILYRLCRSSDRVRPDASHANEEATKDGKLIAGTRTEAFMDAVDTEVHVPLSGVPMHFNSEGVYTEGC